MAVVASRNRSKDIASKTTNINRNRAVASRKAGTSVNPKEVIVAGKEVVPPVITAVVEVDPVAGEVAVQVQSDAPPATRSQAHTTILVAQPALHRAVAVLAAVDIRSGVVVAIVVEAYTTAGAEKNQQKQSTMRLGFFGNLGALFLVTITDIYLKSLTCKYYML